MNLADKETIVKIMKDSSHACLATVDNDQPRVRPVSPIVEDDMSIWIATSASSSKVKQIKANPKVSLAFVKQPSGDEAAIVVGVARIIEDTKTKKRIWDVADFDLKKYFPQGPDDQKYCLLKIIPARIEWRDNWEKTNVYEPQLVV